MLNMRFMTEHNGEIPGIIATQNNIRGAVDIIKVTNEVIDERLDRFGAEIANANLECDTQCSGATGEAYLGSGYSRFGLNACPASSKLSDFDIDGLENGIEDFEKR